MSETGNQNGGNMSLTEDEAALLKELDRAMQSTGGREKASCAVNVMALLHREVFGIIEAQSERAGADLDYNLSQMEQAVLLAYVSSCVVVTQNVITGRAKVHWQERG